MRFDIGKECQVGLQIDKFYQIITELWPLIDVQNCVLLNIILTNGQILIFLLQNIQWWDMLHACSAFIVEKGFC